MMKQIIVGNSLEKLRELQDGSIDCVVTSPPYYGLRDYGTGKWVGGDPNCPHRRVSKYSEKTITGHHQKELAGNVGDAIYKTVCPLCGAVRVDEQIGLEETPQQFIDNLVKVFRECKRILKDDGTLWVNIGDSYATGGGRSERKQSPNPGVGANNEFAQNSVPFVGTPEGCKGKDMIGIPWMLAFALRDDGWYLRQDIIWHKPNPMPESVKDRCVKSHEYIFLLSKKPHYYFDYEAIQEPAEESTYKRLSQDIDNQIGSNRVPGKKNGNMKAVASIRFGGNKYNKQYIVRNKRDVWTITTKPCKEAHFATFPEDLIEPCILAGCPKDGTVLDPFCGSGTTGIVSVRNERNFIGIELNPEYAEMSERRISREESFGIQADMFGKII